MARREDLSFPKLALRSREPELNLPISFRMNYRDEA